MSGADLFALRWLDAVIAVPVWSLMAGVLVLLTAVLFLVRSHKYWAAAPLVLLAIAVAAGVWLPDLYSRTDRKDVLASQLSGWRSQALASQPILACVDTEVDPTVDAACERALFSRPEHLAAASAYVAQSINLLADAQQHAGARDLSFERDLERLRALLERDRFGLVANLLVMEDGCTAHSCDALALFRDPVNVQENITKRVFQTYVARHLEEGGSRPVTVATRPVDAGLAGPAPPAPLPSDYILPSASSIPAISIMNDEGSGASAAPRAATANGGPRPSPPRRTAASSAVELKPLSLSR
jgi:hypothetical protein